MTFEIEQLGRDIVHHHYDAIPDNKTIVRTQNAVQIGSSFCYSLSYDFVKSLDTLTNYQFFFVDFERRMVHHGYWLILQNPVTLNSISFPFRVDDTIYFHQAQFHYSFEISADDMKKFEALCLKNQFSYVVPQVDKRVAAKVIKDLNRDKCAKTIKEFDALIDSLVEGTP